VNTTLFLTRHGETDWNVEGRLQGHMDSPLTLLGKRQARWLGTALKDIKFDAIYSSSSKRAYHTAQIIKDKQEQVITALDSLLEINMGSWEGQQRKNIELKYLEEYTSFWNTPHLYNPTNSGESFKQLEDRIIPTVRDIVVKHRGGNILIVTHAIALKLILAHFRGDPLEKLWTPPIIQPTALSKVSIIDNQYNIDLYGDTSHYQIVRKAVGAIVYQENKFIIVHKVLSSYGKSPGVWDFPKGAVEEGESLEDAVIRELKEETGTDKYLIVRELPEKISFDFSEEIRKKIGFERQETTMFLIEFFGNQDELQPCGKEIDEIMVVESRSLLSKLSHAETVSYIEKHCAAFLC
jgi:broad specificity phosphatase PhoE/8-oxo-dGTP pyrophosphatase MutT (NUDIX family)